MSDASYARHCPFPTFLCTVLTWHSTQLNPGFTDHILPQRETGLQAAIMAPKERDLLDDSDEDEVKPSMSTQDSKQKGRPGLCDDFHFQLLELTDTTWTAQCLHCTDRNSVHSGSCAKPMVTSNLNRHLRTKHPELYKKYQERKGKVGEKVSKQATQEEMNKAILNFVVNNAQPISVVESESFKELLELASGGELKSMTRKKCVQELDEKYQEHLVLLKKELGKYEFICTTCDIWSDKKRSFMGTD